MAEIRVGMVGYQFMGRSHSNAFRQVTPFMNPRLKPRLTAVCGRNESAVKKFARQFGWESYETDYRKLIARDDIDLIDIGSPGNTHLKIAIAAAEAGKHIICEKPLANNLTEAKAMWKAVKKSVSGARVKAGLVLFDVNREPQLDARNAQFAPPQAFDIIGDLRSDA